MLAHTYHARKGGLRTDHLGLHKALCVLMGWNWHVAPDTSRAYESSSAVVEAKALRDDLILWPPLVIIHNSSIGIKVSADKAKIVTTEQMEELLRGQFMKKHSYKSSVAKSILFLSLHL